jgi:hypothetical protein
MQALIFKLGHELAKLMRDSAEPASRKHGSEHACSCCEVHKTRCPPRIVGEVFWKIGRGAVPEASIVVRNVGKVARSFAFTPTALAGSGVGSARLEAQPSAAVLAPGQSTVVSLKLVDSLALQPAQDYRAELTIEGAWQQAVAVTCHVVRDAHDACSVDQGDSFTDKTFHARILKHSLHWQIDRGVTPEATITVHNTGHSSRVFGFEATALVGPGAAGANLVITPATLQIDRGQAAVVRVALQNSLALSAGQTYRTDLLVRGFFDQRLHLRCQVQPDAAAHIEVEQGESPTRVRAHRWTDHFQCTESCTPVT